MFRIVVYHIETRKIIMDLPLIFDQPAYIRQLDTLLSEDFDFRVYCGMEPVFYEDYDDDICLKPNAFLINSNELLK